MSLTLNTNINSLNAQCSLTNSQATLSQVLQRLSSGLRINSAAGGALSTLTGNLQSIRTLAVESANGSNSASDRAALDQQVQQQIAEITRIASQTQFNGLNVLDGSSGVPTYQVGANVGNTISINLSQGVRADQIGQVATGVGGPVTANALGATNPVTIQVGTGTAINIGASQNGSAAGQTNDSAYANVTAINSACVAGLTASATLQASDIATQVNLYSSTTGVTASVSGGTLSLVAADGRNIAVTQTLTAGTGSTVTETGIAAAVSGGIGRYRAVSGGIGRYRAESAAR